MGIRRIPRTKINKECGVKIAFSKSVLFFNEEGEKKKKEKEESKLNRSNRVFVCSNIHRNLIL